MDIEQGRIIIAKEVFSEGDFEEFAELYLDAVIVEETAFGSRYEIQIVDHKRKVEIIKHLYRIWNSRQN